LKGDTVGHAAERVLTLENLKLSGGVLVKELIDREETTTDTNLDLVFDTFDHDTLGAELVDALALAHEHDLELLSVRVVIDVLGKLLVNAIVLDRDVDRDARLQVDDVLTELLNLVVGSHDLSLVLLHLLEHLELRGLGLVELLLKLVDVGGSTFKLNLELAFAGLHTIMMSLPSVSLLLDIVLLYEDRVELENGTLKSNDSLLAFAQAHLEAVNLELVRAALRLHVGLVLSSHLSHLFRQAILQVHHLAGCLFLESLHFSSVAIEILSE